MALAPIRPRPPPTVAPAAAAAPPLVVPSGSRVLMPMRKVSAGARFRTARFLMLAVAGVAATFIGVEVHQEALMDWIFEREASPAIYYYMVEIGLGLGVSLIAFEPLRALLRGSRGFRNRLSWAWLPALRLRGVERASLPARPLAELPEGGWARVRGRVVPGETFTTASGRSGAVVVRYLGAVGPLREATSPDALAAELHGVDFRLALPGGEQVRVEVAGARFEGPPVRLTTEDVSHPPLAVRALGAERLGREGRAASVYHEEVVAIDDEVEVAGRLFREIDPQSEGGSRGARVTAVLRASGRRALVVRARPRARGRE
jgi:hypothetical protein